MPEPLITRRTVLGGLLVGGGVLAGGEVARHYGEQFGEGVRTEIEKTDVQGQYEQFVGLLEGEDLRALIAEKIRQDEIDVQFIIDAVVGKEDS